MNLGSLISINFYYGMEPSPRVEVRGGEAQAAPGQGADPAPAGGQGKAVEEKSRGGGGAGSLYRDAAGRPLSREEVAELLELKSRDQQVRQHEAAHMAAGGIYVRGGPTYSYRIGPDGKRYAVGGEVSIDTSPERDPRQTIAKMRVVERAALAPANPSGQDRLVASKAAMEIIKAQAELIAAESRQKEGAVVQRAAAEGQDRAEGADITSYFGGIDLYV